MNWSRGVTVGLVGLALVGCRSDDASAPTTSSSSPVATTAADRAEAACRAVDPDHFFSAEPGTLDQARGLTYGTGALPLADVFPEKDGSAFIAWCWSNTGGFYDSFIADDAGRSVLTGASSNSPPPPGPPDIP